MGLFGSDKLRAGVIGVGSVAQTAHLPTYAEHPETTLSGVADLNAGRRNEVATEYGAENAYESGEAMIADADLDIVSICTPADTHRDLFVAAAEAGCHIYCEKPMTTDVKSAEAMVAAAEDASIISQIGYTRAYVETYRRVLSLLRNHLLGDIKRLSTHRVRSPPATNWNFDAEVAGGGVVADQLGHMLDFYIRLFETTPTVKDVTLEQLDVPGVEDYAEITFEFNGTPVETILHWTPHAKHHRNVLFGAKGLLEYDMERLTGEIQGETVTQKYGQQPFVDLRGEFRAWWGGANDFHSRRVWDFVDHVAAADHDTVAPAQRGLEITQIIEEVYRRGDFS